MMEGTLKEMGDAGPAPESAFVLLTIKIKPFF
jgi:hypothetical protein